MRVLSRIEADQLLQTVGLKISDWNELTETARGTVMSKAYHPSRNALELYVVSKHLMCWIGCGGWTLLQIDNSTAPADDEVKIFEELVFHTERTWDVGDQKSFLFCNDTKPGSGRDQTTLVLLVFCSLMFEWHVHLTSDVARGQRLALLDGVVYFFGDGEALERADMLIRRSAENPLQLQSEEKQGTS